LLLPAANSASPAPHSASDKTGTTPADRAVTPPDLFATFLHLLGIRPNTQLTNLDGCVLPATSGTPLAELW
jgi:hypothetical protein